MTRLEPARGLAARGEMPGAYAHLAEAIAALRAARVPRQVAEARALATPWARAIWVSLRGKEGGRRPLSLGG